MRFNVVEGRVFLDSCFDAQGVIIEHFEPRTKFKQQKFLYFGAIVGRENRRNTWSVREFKLFPRLPIGIFKNCYFWKPKLGAYLRKGGTEVVATSGGLHKLTRIEVFSELISHDDSEDEIERIYTADADRRICFTFDNDESIAFEADDSGNQPLLITTGEQRPFDRSFDTLKSRLVLKETNAANLTSIGH
ncbi:hypothetical protein [Microvirga guangxiensis]|uniref:hypothetical protein n=1 Tax=Microvirga guangxiensis TaxID=549386 RepID=UPI001586FCCA|nr:hypothetical protein [Microvirga guangxiensis]